MKKLKHFIKYFYYSLYLINLITNWKKILKKAKLLQTKKEAGNNAFKTAKYQEAYDLYSESLEIDVTNKAMNSILHCNRATAAAKVFLVKIFTDLN